MLWHKTWLETRSRFLIGLVLLTVMTCGSVIEYPQIRALIPLADAIEANSPIGRLVKEAVDLQRDYRGYIWVQLFQQNLAHMGTLFAALLGSGGLLAQASGGAALFTLSLPVSRAQVLRVRAATGLAELLVLLLVPALLVPLLSPAVGQTFGFGSALVYGACTFVVATVFFSLAFLLSSVFSDLWRPLLLTCGVALLLAGLEFALRNTTGYGVFGVMSAESYFRSGHVPWVGLVASAAASVGMLYAATLSIERRDF